MIVEPDFPDHWKTQLVVKTLGAAAALGIVRLWAHCQQRRDDTFDLTAPQLAAVTKIDGNPRTIERALIEARFIEREGKMIHVRGWRERNAGLLASIENGRKGGRPRKNPQETNVKPTGNPQVTHGQPIANLGETDKRRGEESRAESAPQAPRASAPTRVREGALPETWDFILALLGAKKRRAGAEAEHALARQAEALPLSELQRTVLEWFYQLPHDDRDIDLRGRFRDADKLAINLFASLERAERYAERHGGPQKKEGAAEPAGWPRWYAEKWPDKPLPENFADLPDYLQQDARRELQSERSAA